MSSLCQCWWHDIQLYKENCELKCQTVGERIWMNYVPPTPSYKKLVFQFSFGFSITKSNQTILPIHGETQKEICEQWIVEIIPDSKVHGANMGHTWVLSAPDGPHIGPMNLANIYFSVYCSIRGSPRWGGGGGGGTPSVKVIGRLPGARWL